jgi:MYXO-CTERM domain-containing protein
VKRALFVTNALAILLASPAAHAQSECRNFDTGEEVATLQDDRINEASGLAASWTNPGILWVHNDSGDSPRIFALDHAGETVTVVNLADVTAPDWEDMAVGPCAEDDPTPCVYVADIGDNDAERNDVALLRFPEPDLGQNPPDTLEVESVDRIEFTYAEGPRDAETLLIHPVDARIFVVDKTAGDPSNLWRVQWEDDSTAQKVASTSTGEDFIFGNRVTGGDFSPDGTEFSIRTYNYLYTYCGEDPVAAFTEEPSSVIPVNLKQSEALTYARDGESIWTTTEVVENIPAPLVRLSPLTPPTPEPAPEPAPDVAMVDTSSDASTGPDAAPLDDGGDAATPTGASTSGASCACTTNQKTGSLWEAGLLVLALVGLRRRRTPC